MKGPRKRMWTRWLGCAWLVMLVPTASEATPSFGRMYRVDCSGCHSAPPCLNTRGLRFLASGYWFETDGRWRTIPMAIWNTGELEWRQPTAASRRQRGGRAEYQLITGRSRSDGWFAAVTAPFTGELTIPLTDAARFELVGGMRIDVRTGPNRPPAIFHSGNGRMPFGPPAFRQAPRLQIEPGVQPANHGTTIAFSHLF